MRFAYADPPYLGCCARYEHFHPDGRCWDDVTTHTALLGQLCDEFPDGWALSLSASSMYELLPLCPPDVRIAAWVKGWCSWKPNVYPAYAWEPVIFRGGRKPDSGDKTWMTARDWVQCNVTTNEPVIGAKPQQFCDWVFALLGARAGDDFVDIFPGSGAVDRAWLRWQSQFDFAITEAST